MEALTKPGYKNTELGSFPEDWEVKNLNDIGFFKKGKGIKKDQVSIDGVGCVRYGELYTQYDSVIRETKSKIPKTLIPETQKIEKGDLLFAGSGETKEEIGKCAAYLGVNAIYAGGDIIILTPKTGDSIFLGYLLNQSLISKQKALYGQGDAVVHIYSSGLGKVKIPLPPLLEQTAIATALSDMDSYIQSLEALIAKKRLIKQGAMQELLTPKEDWEERKLGEVGETIIGLTYKPENIQQDGKLVLRSSNIQNGKLDFKDNVYVDLEISEKLTLRENDLLICVRNGSRDLIGKCALITGSAVGETFGAFMSVFRSEYNRFIVHLFNSDVIKRQIEEYLGATINQITNKSLNSFEIPFPSISEQNRLAGILNEMESEIDSLEKTLNKSLLLKQGMMQELLTGRTRLV